MRILFVCPWIPGPQRPRAYGILKMLAKEHEVRVVCLKDRDGNANDLVEIGLAGIDVVSWRRARGVLRSSVALFRGGSLQIALVAERRMKVAIGEALTTWRPDVIHLNVIRTGGLMPEDHYSARLVFDADEKRSDYYHQVAKSSHSWMWRLLGSIEGRRLERAEKRLVAQSDTVLVSSPADVHVFARPAHLVRSPNPVSEVDRNNPDVGSILFLGRMNYQANVEAVSWFSNKVLPRVRDIVPHAKLLIVGANPTKEVLDLGNKAVEVVGAVETVDEYYSSAAIAIVPNQLATGVQMKLIQAAGAGVPIVSTRVCSSRAGLPNDALLVADTAAEWQDAVVNALVNEVDSKVRAGQAQEWAIENYSDESILRALRAAYAGEVDA